MSDVTDQVINVVAVEYLNEYKLKITFNDGNSKIVDFEAFLRKSRHPDIQKYLEIEKFKEFSIVDGNLDWNDFELCFPVNDLYNGTIF